GEVAEQLLEHRGVDRVAGVGAVEAEDRHARLINLIRGQRVHAAARPSAIDATTRSASSAHAATSARTSSSGSRKRPRTYEETTSGSVLSARPTPPRTRQKSGPPRPVEGLLRPLWPSSPPPSPDDTPPTANAI